MKPTPWQRILVWLGRAFLLTYLKLQVYNGWSKLVRFVWERKQVLPVRRFADLGDLVAFVRTLKWRADSWRQLWDAVSSPEHVEWLAVNEAERFVGDCDDFAAYEVEVVETQGAVRKNFGIAGAEMLTVGWYKYAGEATEGNPMGYCGHNVCLLRYNDGTYAFMDYGWPSWRRASIPEVVRDVLFVYAPESYLLGWARTGRDGWCREVSGA